MNNIIVIKVGSDNITKNNKLNHEKINELAEEISQLHQSGYKILVVSSGAIASGACIIRSLKKTDDATKKRLLASVGQCYLMEAWIRAFDPIKVAQTLLTWQDLEVEKSRSKAKVTICGLIDNGIIPIINENDAVADEEIRFTDNDQLAVKLAKLINAERLIMLTNVNGLFSEDPKKHKGAKLITTLDKVDDRLLARIEDSKSKCGRGGMRSKVSAAKEALEHGILTNIINGEKRGLIVAVVRDGLRIGTEFRNQKYDFKN